MTPTTVPPGSVPTPDLRRYHICTTGTLTLKLCDDCLVVARLLDYADTCEEYLVRQPDEENPFERLLRYCDRCEYLDPLQTLESFDRDMLRFRKNAVAVEAEIDRWAYRRRSLDAQFVPELADYYRRVGETFDPDLNPYEPYETNDGT